MSKFKVGDKVRRLDFRYLAYGPVRTIIDSNKNFYYLDNEVFVHGMFVHGMFLQLVDKTSFKQKIKINLSGN